MSATVSESELMLIRSQSSSTMRKPRLVCFFNLGSCRILLGIAVDSSGQSAMVQSELFSQTGVTQKFCPGNFLDSL